MISIIAAHDQNQGIGYRNQLPWYIPEDLLYFKKMTLGKTIVMGRKTFESIGRPLPKRKNVVVTRQQDYSAEEVTVVHSLQQALSLANIDAGLMVIGGEQMYREALPLADRLYLTLVKGTFEVDTYFPRYDQDFEMIDQRLGQEDHLKFFFTVWQRKY